MYYLHSTTHRYAKKYIVCSKYQKECGVIVEA